MTIHEVIDLFSHEMIDVFYHSSADELSKDEFVNAVHEVASTVLKTYEAQTKSISSMAVILIAVRVTAILVIASFIYLTSFCVCFQILSS